MKSVEVIIKGVAPLLQHRYELKTEVEDYIKKRAGNVDYSLDWLKALYWDGNEIYHPASHIEGALVRASSSFQIPGKRKKTYKDLVKAFVVISPDNIPLNGLKGDPIKLLEEGKFTIDRRRVVVIRAAVERERPRFEEWSLKFMVEVYDDQLPLKALKEIFDYAGKNGIGDYRPKFGRFQVISFKEK